MSKSTNLQNNNDKVSMKNKGSIVFLIFILFLPLLNAVWFFPVQESFEKSVSDAQLTKAENLKLRTTLFLNETLDSINETARLVSVESSEEEVRKIFARLFKTNTSLIKLLYVDSSGEDSVRFQRFTEELAKDNSYRESDVIEDVFITRSLRGETLISDIYLTDSLTPVVDIYVPVIFGGKVLGVVGGAADIRNLNNAFEEFSKLNMQAYLVDNRGFVLVHTDPSMVFKRSNVLDRNIVKEVLSKEVADGLDKNFRYTSEVGVKTFAVGVPLDNGWGVIVGTSEDLAFERINTIRNIAIAISLVMFVFALLVIISTLRIHRAQRDLELALSEAQRLAVIVEKSFEAIMIVNQSDNKYVYVNPAWEEMTGWYREDVIGIETPKILNSGKYDKSFFKEMWEKISSGETFVGEMINKKKDGSFYDSEVIIIPIRDKNNTIIFYAEISRDITERKTAELELKTQSDELERSNKLMVGRELKMIELKEKIKQLEVGKDTEA